MKKILSILLPGLLWCNFGFAYDTHPNDFTNWLFKNGYSEYVEEINVCKVEKKYSKKWFDFRCENRPNGVFVKKNKLKINFYKDRSNIPWNAKPNYDTLLYYLFSYIKRVDSGKYWETEGSKNPYIFESDLREDKYIDKQLKKTALVSYLLFENDKITIDKKSPKDRFGILVQDDTKLISMSVGKSMVSYVLGHAICGGYIDNVNSKIDDWPLIKNTLYDGQSILD